MGLFKNIKELFKKSNQYELYKDNLDNLKRDLYGQFSYDDSLKSDFSNDGSPDSNSLKLFNPIFRLKKIFRK